MVEVLGKPHTSAFLRVDAVHRSVQERSRPFHYLLVNRLKVRLTYSLERGAIDAFLGRAFDIRKALFQLLFSTLFT